MRPPPIELVRRVEAGAVDRRLCRDVLHYRGYFRAFDKDGQVVHTDPGEIVRVELTPRAVKEFGDD